MNYKRKLIKRINRKFEQHKRVRKFVAENTKMPVSE